ncbi:MAG: hypothetical protein WBA48_15915 [Xanthobacteraceae bacterium]
MAIDSLSYRHGRIYSGHSRLSNDATRTDVDGWDKPGPDGIPFRIFPAIHLFKKWMRGSSPRMTADDFITRKRKCPAL